MAAKPEPSLAMTFSAWMTVMPFRPATPTTGSFFCPFGSFRTIIVPGCSGCSVFLILIGIPISDTGSTESVCSTEAPM